MNLIPSSQISRIPDSHPAITSWGIVPSLLKNGAQLIPSNIWKFQRKEFAEDGGVLRWYSRYNLEGLWLGWTCEWDSNGSLYSRVLPRLWLQLREPFAEFAFDLGQSGFRPSDRLGL